MVHGVWLLHSPSATSTDNKHASGTIPQFCRIFKFWFLHCYYVPLRKISYKKKRCYLISTDAEKQAKSGFATNSHHTGVRFHFWSQSALIPAIHP